MLCAAGGRCAGACRPSGRILFDALQRALVALPSAGDRHILKFTEYFRYTRDRADRARIHDEWIRQAIEQPVAQVIQGDGRIRRWAYIAEEARYLRVVLLADGETVHNAFFDRRFKP
jgi:hypothetical protein